MSNANTRRQEAYEHGRRDERHAIFTLSDEELLRRTMAYRASLAPRRHPPEDSKPQDITAEIHIETRPLVVETEPATTDS